MSSHRALILHRHPCSVPSLAPPAGSHPSNITRTDPDLRRPASHRPASQRLGTDLTMSHSQATPAFATLPPPLSERVARASRSVTPMSFVPPPSAAQTPHATAPTLLTQPLPQRTASRPHPDGGIGATSGTVVVLFRADLRLHDHAALTHALEEGARVVPVYVFDTRHFGTSKNG
eukprot:IDg20049t1